MPTTISSSAAHGMDLLRRDDPLLYSLLEKEHTRQTETLAVIAAASVADPSVVACEGTSLGNVTTEGYPGARFHGGCEVIDQIERLAVDRAMQAFGAQYANVQPHSGSSANQAIMFSLLQPGDVLLGMELSAGGHLTHGSRASVSGRHFRAVSYGVDESGWIDYPEVARTARAHRPRMIVCGASAYPRTIDFAAFRAMADEVGAYLLADISHIAGLVATGLHPSPIDHAHFTTTSTYKQLYGPRGGLILSGQDAHRAAGTSARTLADLIQSAVFPSFQGTPRLNTIAAKARALAIMSAPAFRALTDRILSDARALADALAGLGHHVLSGGTDNHIVLVDVGRESLTGLLAEQALESCGIVVNRNKIVNDPRGPATASGLRFGTNILAARGMEEPAVRHVADLVDRVLRAVRPHQDGRGWDLSETVREEVLADVADLCREYPLRQLDAG